MTVSHKGQDNSLGQRTCPLVPEAYYKQNTKKQPVLAAFLFFHLLQRSELVNLIAALALSFIECIICMMD